MKTIRAVRIALAALFLILSALFISLEVSEGSHAGTSVQHHVTSIAYKAQIIPSAIAVGIGAVLFWIIITIFYGRIYCATVCPVGTLIDACSHLRRFVRPRAARHYRFKRRSRIPIHILVIYSLCLVGSIAVVPALIEPWSILRNIIVAVHPGATATAAIGLGLGAATGIVAGLLSLLVIAGYAAFSGRDFCNYVCPVGTALSLVGANTAYRVEIDPDKCVNCMRCEEVCPASCVKVVSRYVDDRRCVRCFRCIDVCPNDAIRYQRTRNRAATPMLRRVKRAGSK